jgi:hypothetical protein
MKRDHAREKAVAVLVGEHVHAAVLYAGDNGVRRAEIDSDDAHRSKLAISPERA